MINDEQEKIILKQLNAINQEFKILTSHMSILNDYFDKLIESYKNQEYFD